MVRETSLGKSVTVLFWRTFYLLAPTPYGQRSNDHSSMLLLCGRMFHHSNVRLHVSPKGGIVPCRYRSLLIHACSCWFPYAAGDVSEPLISSKREKKPHVHRNLHAEVPTTATECPPQDCLDLQQRTVQKHICVSGRSERHAHHKHRTTIDEILSSS